MEVIKVLLGDLQTNCYILINDISECVIVDPGAEAEKLKELIDLRALELKALLITHGHFDHIGAVKKLQAYYDIPVYAHKSESIMMSDANKNLSSMFARGRIECEATEFLAHNDIVDLDNGFQFKVIEVAGHTSHSLCYLHEDGHLFTGDTLFQGAVGRTDLYDGSPRDLMVNIQEKLFVLDGELIVYPGHGSTSTIQAEIDTNPFFRF